MHTPAHRYIVEHCDFINEMYVSYYIGKEIVFMQESCMSVPYITHPGFACNAIKSKYTHKQKFTHLRIYIYIYICVCVCVCVCVTVCVCVRIYIYIYIYIYIRRQHTHSFYSICVNYTLLCISLSKHDDAMKGAQNGNIRWCGAKEIDLGCIFSTESQVLCKNWNVRLRWSAFLDLQKQTEKESEEIISMKKGGKRNCFAENGNHYLILSILHAGVIKNIVKGSLILCSKN